MQKFEHRGVKTRGYKIAHSEVDVWCGSNCIHQPFDFDDPVINIHVTPPLGLMSQFTLRGTSNFGFKDHLSDWVQKQIRSTPQLLLVNYVCNWVLAPAVRCYAKWPFTIAVTVCPWAFRPRSEYYATEMTRLELYVGFKCQMCHG